MTRTLKAAEHQAQLAWGTFFQFIRGMWKRCERHQCSQLRRMVPREAGAYDGASTALEVPVCRSSRSSPLIHNFSFAHSVLSATLGPSTTWNPPPSSLWSKERRFGRSQTRSCQRCKPVTPSNRKWGKIKLWWRLSCDANVSLFWDVRPIFIFL